MFVSELLKVVFNDEDALVIFCYDHFPSVYKKFVTSNSYLDKIQLLIEYCGEHKSEIPTNESRTSFTFLFRTKLFIILGVLLGGLLGGIAVWLIISPPVTSTETRGFQLSTVVTSQPTTLTLVDTPSSTAVLSLTKKPLPVYTLTNTPPSTSTETLIPSSGTSISTDTPKSTPHPTVVITTPILTGTPPSPIYVSSDQIADQIGAINELAISPDGRTLAVESSSGIWLYNGETSEPLYLQTGEVSSWAWSPDGQLALCSGDTIQVWDVRTGTLLYSLRLTQHPGEVCSLALSPDGASLASFGANNRLSLWVLRPVGTTYVKGSPTKYMRGEFAYWTFYPCYEPNYKPHLVLLSSKLESERENYHNEKYDIYLDCEGSGNTHRVGYLRTGVLGAK